MKASPEHQARLLDLQALDTRLAQLAHREKTLPEVAAAAGVRGQLDGVRAVVAERAGVVEDTRTELSRIEADVAVVEARMTRDRDRLQATSSAKDITALEQELAALAKRRSDLEDIELAVMERLEEAEAALGETEHAAEALGEHLADADAARDAALAAIAAERASTIADRDAVAAALPADLLALYEKQRARYGFGASHLRFGVSSATGVTLLADELATVRAAAPDDVILCPSSDAILVRTAESGL
ncbi:hypothetical protein QT381_02950 [Galbitalea sp. SE-J8]|uniref:zinc ribbon domain-containing protein n=1 Tax=Galbitalea sp. SE-J8 TaxID=3054952 RepID=UPI00259D0A0A|nr:hypothetical protein [Galbitalea sp. SE-J8]MDM4761962.1 hypothetical protein [Galbitalea sp. SE-J8]